jgi:hypothetical protein
LPTRALATVGLDCFLAALQFAQCKGLAGEGVGDLLAQEWFSAVAEELQQPVVRFDRFLVPLELAQCQAFVEERNGREFSGFCAPCRIRSPWLQDQVVPFQLCLRIVVQPNGCGQDGSHEALALFLGHEPLSEAPGYSERFPVCGPTDSIPDKFKLGLDLRKDLRCFADSIDAPDHGL